MPSPRAAFTEREREVIWRFTMGASEAEIAQALGVDEEVVRAHLKHLMEKLSLHLRIEHLGG